MINLRCRNWTTTEATVSGCSVVRALPASRAAACAVEATNGPAVQSLTWTPTVKNPRLKKVFPRTETGPPLSSENFQEQKRASLSTRVQIHANNWFYSMTWGTGDHLWGAVGGGQLCLLFVVGSTTRKIALHAARFTMSADLRSSWQMTPRTVWTIRTQITPHILAPIAHPAPR